MQMGGADYRLVPTPTDDALPRRFADFATLGEALDYAAQGARGLNFHDPRGTLVRAYSYAELQSDATDAAYRLIARDTVEEKILELQARKKELAESIISEDNSVLRRLEVEDLEMLLS